MMRWQGEVGRVVCAHVCLSVCAGCAMCLRVQQAWELLALLGRAPLENRHPALFMVSLVLLGPACGTNEAMMKDKPLSEETPLAEPGLCQAG